MFKNLISIVEQRNMGKALRVYGRGLADGKFRKHYVGESTF